MPSEIYFQTAFCWDRQLQGSTAEAVQSFIGLDLVKLHGGFVALLFVQFDFTHQRIAVDFETVEDLAGNGGFRSQGQCPFFFVAV